MTLIYIIGKIIVWFKVLDLLFFNFWCTNCGWDKCHRKHVRIVLNGQTSYVEFIDLETYF